MVFELESKVARKSTVWPGSVQKLHESMTAGLYRDSHPPRLFTLTNQNGMTVTLMDIGATWLSCTLPVAGSFQYKETHREVLLGINTIEKFQQQEAYLGSTIGRYANRIAHGQFELNGQVVKLSKNSGEHTLHGGEDGFDKRRWDVIDTRVNSVTFGLSSPDGDQGFPGNMDIKVSYVLTDNNQVEIDYTGTLDKLCPVNLTNHAYFNLEGKSGRQSCLAHKMRIFSDQFLATNEQGIPFEIKSVSGTGLDFQIMKSLQDDFLSDSYQRAVNGYDHSFIVQPEDGNTKNIVKAAQVISPDNKILMNIYTSMPAIQLYTGNFLEGCPSRSNDVYLNYSGFALETQYLPDAPNHPEWKVSTSLIKPDEVYFEKTIYEFSF